MLSYEINLHIEETHDLLLHSDVSKFFVNTLPKPLLSTGIGLPDPAMKLCHDRSACGLSAKRPQERETVLVRAVVEVGLDLRGQAAKSQAVHSLVEDDLSDGASIED